MWKKLCLFALVAGLVLGGLHWAPPLPPTQTLVQGAVALMPVAGAHSPLSWDLAHELGEIMARRLGGRVDLMVDQELSSLQGYDRALLCEPIRYEKGEGSLVVETRLTCYDLSGEEPTLIAEWSVEQEHPLPEADGLIDYETLSHDDYLHTPLAVAHHRIATEMAEGLPL
ncbi:MAG: hypothetical protein AB7F31_06650 [Parachlamydiales bacterium]